MDTCDSDLIFAPLTRVSTDAQKKRGESLRVQEEYMDRAMNYLGGRPYKWYSGSEHATPEQEREKLDELLRDAGHKKFNAVMVCDTSRWSRDNKRSKGDLKYLRDNGIRFFVGTMEYNLYDPSHNFMLGMGVEVEEFYAAQQNYKSILSCIAKAKKGYPTKGRLPYARTFDRKTGQWGLDPKKHSKAKYAVDRYLQGTSTRDLSKVLGICKSQVHELFSKRLGEDEEIRFNSKKFKISETVPFKIPPLVPDDVIRQVKERMEANKTWNHGQLKNKYLLGRMIFCGHCGYALVGAEYHGRLYYRHQAYRNCGAFHSIRADDIEDRVFETIFEHFGDSLRISELIKRGLPDLEKIKSLNQQIEVFKQDIQDLETQGNRIINAIADGKIIDEDASDKMKVIRETKSTLKENILHIETQLNSMPTEKQINVRAQLVKATLIGIYKGDGRKAKMTFENKRRLLQYLFSGKTSDGKRTGVFITYNKERRRPWLYEIRGILRDSLIDSFNKEANVNLISKDNPGNGEDTGHHRP